MEDIHRRQHHPDLAAYQHSTKQMASLAGTVSLGPWGGSGGNNWHFRAQTGIAEITVCADKNNIKSISFTDANGGTSETFGGKNPHDLGKEKKIPINWPSEFCTTISGTYGEYAGQTVIMSLTFTTNLNTFGPFGGTGGDQFSIPIADSVVVGFHGRCGDFLDALGILVQPYGRISLGPWGGPGGDPFSFKVANWIKEITIYHGACVAGIAFKDAEGNESGKFAGYDKEAVVEKIIKIAGPSEYLTSITGTYGIHKYPTPVITSLLFKTNLTTHGPFGTATGTPFSIPIEGSFVNGFYGRGCGLLDSIGIFVKPMPAEI